MMYASAAVAASVREWGSIFASRELALTYLLLPAFSPTTQYLVTALGPNFAQFSLPYGPSFKRAIAAGVMALLAAVMAYKMGKVSQSMQEKVVIIQRKRSEFELKELEVRLFNSPICWHNCRAVHVGSVRDDDRQGHYGWLVNPPCVNSLPRQ